MILNGFVTKRAGCVVFNSIVGEQTHLWVAPERRTGLEPLDWIQYIYIYIYIFYVIDWLDGKALSTIKSNVDVDGSSFANQHNAAKRALKIWVRIRDRVGERLFNSSLLALHYHNTYPFHPMSYRFWIKPTWRVRALETLLVWKSKIIVLVLNLVLVIQSKDLYNNSAFAMLAMIFTWRTHKHCRFPGVDCFLKMIIYFYRHWFLAAPESIIFAFEIFLRPTH